MVEGENDSSIYARLVSFDDGEGQVAGRYPFHQFLNQGIMESPRRCQNDNFLSKQKKIAFLDETVKNFPVLAFRFKLFPLILHWKNHFLYNNLKTLNYGKEQEQ